MFYRSVFLVLIIGLISCSQEKISIAGTIEKIDQNFVNFDKRGNFSKEVLLNKENQFVISSDSLKKGYYTINNIVIYISPGFDLKMKIQGDKVLFDGIGAEENNFLQKSKLIYDRYQTTSSAFDDLIKKNLKDYKKDIHTEIEELKRLLNSSDFDNNFVSAERKKLEVFPVLALTTYADNYGVNQDAFKKAKFMISQAKGDEMRQPEFRKKMDSLRKETFRNKLPKKKIDSLKSIVDKDININDSILFFGESLVLNTIIENKLRHYASKNRRADTINKRFFLPNQYYYKTFILDSFTYPPLREYYLYKTSITGINGSTGVFRENFRQFYLKNSVDKNYINVVEQVIKEAKKIEVGNPSPVFENYENVLGGTSSLVDFKGKYVYIDVWATWCVPCKREIPYLKELEEEYKNSTIEFVSISVDKIEDRDVWKKYINKEQLRGIQLLADHDFDSNFIKSYAVKSIPKFILIDPDGNIVSSSAPRPSDMRLKKLFVSKGIVKEQS
ncbi:TlpA family protein disulfide reductase [Aquimarina sp. AD10]|uniref:TlpA family protein disulfide reductase n=1 Tax=Aquimarina sp. AD10 TaxID=1714849 RepID=UPI000E4AAB7D|nr:TlpA disulfide reductase family protein [Aquimarina sp. AD10]AXT60328.1 TlpA family protein disulfide reductase [Aquimarina sp. AD10]RKN01238.1 TlpA family protein disulfide reductase [Aquimarina sp. AD10]